MTYTYQEGSTLLITLIMLVSLVFSQVHAINDEGASATKQIEWKSNVLLSSSAPPDIMQVQSGLSLD